MKPRIWYAHGKWIDGVYCAYCDRQRRGQIIRECFRWRVRLVCGHMVNRGFTLPIEELERKGLINYAFSEDPRLTAKKKQAFEGMMFQLWEARRKVQDEEMFAGGTSVF